MFTTTRQQDAHAERLALEFDSVEVRKLRDNGTAAMLCRNGDELIRAEAVGVDGEVRSVVLAEDVLVAQG